MSYNGSGTFQINTSGQPVVTGTVISSSAFNALTADLATGLSTAITKDGQTATTVRIPFAQGINSSLATDTSSGSTGSIFTAGGVGITKALYVGTNATVVGTLGVTGAATFSTNPVFSALTASSAVATDASKNLVSVTNTGTGNNVLATSPTLVTPALGTPSSGVMTNVTGINYDGFKNRIINGAMVIDQRNAGASVTITTAAEFGVDRWRCQAGANNKLTLQQNAGSVTAPVGFTNYLGATSSSAYTVGSTESFSIAQYIEGFNTADLQWGTANAATVTLSFWVRSSLTGTFSGALANSAVNRSYPFSYTISAANTWEYKTITIAGDTSGTWIGATNGVGVRIWINLGAGTTLSTTGGAWAAGDYRATTSSVSVVGTNGATFYITGVQLEKGSTATSFDYRPYGTELALCQRYYYRIVAETSFGRFGPAYVQNTTASQATIAFPVTMRTRPSALEQSGTASDYAMINLATATTCSAVPAYNSGTNSFGATVGTTVTAGLVAGNGAQFTSASGVTTAYLGWSAEL